jgi:hypothetical protein
MDPIVTAFFKIRHFLEDHFENGRSGIFLEDWTLGVYMLVLERLS